MFRFVPLAIVAILLFSVIGPLFSDPYGERRDELVAAINGNLQKSRQSLDSNTLPYDKILAQYANDARDMVPDRAPVIAKLAEMGSAANPKFAEIEKERDLIVKGMEDGSIEPEIAVDRLALLEQASRPDVIDEGLVDEIDTIAAMTNGRLAPVGTDRDKLKEPGARLVGNPGYGRWERQPDGSLLWVWLGTWAVMSSLHSGPTYANWYYDRPWSYDYDRYRSNLGSGTWRQNEMNHMRTSWSNIQREGGQRKRSPYQATTRQSTRMGPNPVYRQSGGGVYQNFSKTRAQAATSGPRKASIYSNPSNPSGFASSSRSGSRSSSRGK